ncbi:hypothetical protein MNBD_ACTINO01-376 [hydrothermal vent metagenome]|uniref:HD-GYP domain-containing protein n=1 Tax=hydrothermal vent metagenome TaxID=652676 RepID=A0A3B0SUZ3_9ZZZZ
MGIRSRLSPVFELVPVVRPIGTPERHTLSGTHRSLRVRVPLTSLPTAVSRSTDADGIASLARLAIRRDAGKGERGHSGRVASLSRAVAAQMGHVDPETAYLVGLLHDVGKTLLPWDPATISRRLTSAETSVVRSHSELGARAAEQAGASREVIQGILFHHERLDGTGYPGGFRGRAVPALSRIVAVVDVYDALANARSYKVAWPIGRVHAYIRWQSGNSLSSQVVASVLDVTDSGLIQTSQEHS